MNKTCNFCGNKNFKSERVQYVYKHDGKFMIVNEVPCEKCEYCSEQYFEANVLKRIETDFLNLQSNRKHADAEITVPVEQYA